MKDFQMNRRQALIAGGLGTASMGMPGSVLGSDKLDARGNAVASDKNCIFVLLCGGPSHVDTWDMKPNAPEAYRGAISNYFDAMHNLLSGQSAKRVQQCVPNDQPYLGSFVAKHKPSRRNIVSNAWLIKCVGRPVFCAPNLALGGYLGSAYAPVFVGSANNHPAMEKFMPPKIYDLADTKHLTQRRKLHGSIESNTLAKDALGQDWADLREKAYDAMTRPEGREAFDLKREPTKVRERYGMHPLGQNLLLARRMVEAGVRFVTVNGWTGQSNVGKKGPPSSSWDMHGGNMGMGNAFGNGSYGMGFCLPRLDQALSGLFTDLKERGMMDNTLVVVTGEFGRTPKVLTQKPPGRQHWPKCFSSILAGCGIAGGHVYGKSDKYGASVTSNPVRPEELAATIYHALDIPLDEPQNNSARPITTGKPVLELFG